MAFSQRKFNAANLQPGKSYRVISPFADFDGFVHPVGERWRFIEKSFLPYEDGLSLFVEKDGKEVSIRLQWRDETQGHIIDNFSDFIEEV